jgi:hypothetical protein
VNAVTVPVFIISFNRLTCLQRLIAWLETAELAEPIVVDNGSTYEPLLEWFESMRGTITIRRCHDNYGPYRVWDERLFEPFTSPGQPFYAVTDPDVVPTGDCPRDAIPRLIEVWRATQCPKVGLSLRLAGIPNSLPSHAWVRQWEASMQSPEIVQMAADPNGRSTAYYPSMLDTTFQVNHRDLVPPSKGSDGHRLAFPYEADHLGWQIDPMNLSDEDRFYWQTASARASTIETLKGFGVVARTGRA